MGNKTRSQHFAGVCHPKKQIGKIAIVFLTCYAMLAGAVVVLNITTQNAMAQVETCPSGYYLATNNLCYPYQQQQQQSQPTAANPDLIHICKIDRDMIAVDKGLGVNQSKLLPLENLYNDTCGTIVGLK